MNIKTFNEIQFNKDTSFAVLHLNIASLNKYIDDINDLMASIYQPIKVIGITEHKI